MAGLNFSNDIEARHFADTVKGKLFNRMTRLQGLACLRINFGNLFLNQIIVSEKRVINHNSNFQPTFQPTDTHQGGLSMLLTFLS